MIERRDPESLSDETSRHRSDPIEETPPERAKRHASRIEIVGGAEEGDEPEVSAEREPSPEDFEEPTTALQNEAPRETDGEEPATPKKRRARKPRTKAERMVGTHHEVLDVDGAADALGVSRRLVFRLLRRGELPGKKVGREWRLSRTAILQWLKTPQGSGKREPSWLETAIQSGRAELGGERGKGAR